MSAASLGKLLDLIANGTISGRIAKDLFVAMEETAKDPAVLVEERGLKQVTDTGPIEAAIKAVIDANPASSRPTGPSRPCSAGSSDRS